MQKVCLLMLNVLVMHTSNNQDDVMFIPICLLDYILLVFKALSYHTLSIFMATDVIIVSEFYLSVGVLLYFNI